MNIIARIWRVFFPPSRWQYCQPLSEAERKAYYEIRLGQHKAAERMRQARVAQVFDDRATVRAKIQPNLPKDNVVQIRRKRAA